MRTQLRASNEAAVPVDLAPASSAPMSLVWRVGMLLLGLVAFAWMPRLLYFGDMAQLWWTNGAWAVAALCAALRCYATMARLRHRRRHAWMCWGHACLAWFLGSLWWGYMELSLQDRTPFPAWSDIGFLAFAPLMMAGMFFYHAEHRAFAITARQAGNLGVILAGLCALAILGLGPALQEADHTPLFAAVALAYPVLYGTAFLFGLVCLWSYVDPRDLSVFPILLTGLGVHAVIDAMYAAALLFDAYQTGHALDIWWLVGFGIIYLAGYLEVRPVRESQRSPAAAFTWDAVTALETLVPSLTVLTVLLFLMRQHDALHTATAPLVTATGIVLACSLGVREWWAFRAEQNLGRELREKEARYRGLLENGPLAIVACDRSGRVLAANARTMHIVGAPSVEALYELNLLTGPRMVETGLAAVASDCMATGETGSGQIEFETIWGTTANIEYHFAPIRDAAGAVVGAQAFLVDITQRIANERALRDSERSLAKAQQIAHMGNWDWDIATNELRWSDEIYRIFGVAPQEFGATYDAFLQFVHPDDRAAVQQAVDAALADDVPYAIDHRIVRSDGAERIVHEQGEVSRTAGGRPTRMVGTVQDITERKLTEAALRASEEQYRSLVENAPLVVAALDTDGRLVAINPAGVALAGAPSTAAVLGRNILETIANDTGVAPAMRRCLERGTVETGEAQFTSSWGRVIDVRFHFAPMRDADGAIVGVQAIGEDVTERKRAEGERLLLASALEQAEEMILVTDANGIIEYVNPAFERITGYARAEALGNTPAMLQSGVHDAEFYAALWRTILNGNTWRGYFSNRRKDGTIFVEEAVISPVRDRAGTITHFVKAMRDVTQEKELEGQLRQAQKLEAIGTLAGGIAHDFNNLLTPILGFAEMAQQTVPPASPLTEYLDQIMEAATRARDLVGQILAFSRRGRADPLPIAIEPLIKETLRLMRAALPATVQIEPQLQAPAGSVVADPTQLHQVVMNLCTNAGQAMPDGGVLSVHLDEVALDADFCATQPGLAPGRYVRLAVSDTGLGMDEATRARIFEPYFTTKPAGQGTGLGLAVVHGIVKELRGAITVRSATGRGSTFELYLPAAGEDPYLRCEPPAQPRGGDEVILFVDDEPQVRAFAQTTLSNFGYRVRACASGAEALARLRAAGRQIRLVIADLTMPGITGIELCREIRALDCDLPVILCTGFLDDRTAAAIGAVAPAEFLAKPFDGDTLAHAVRRVLDNASQALRN